MATVKRIHFKNLVNFSEDNSCLSIVQRKKPKEADEFFNSILLNSFNVNAVIYKKSIMKDINNILSKVISKEVKKLSFFNYWIKDMVKISKTFFKILGKDSIYFSLETSRGCKRYHIDNVPIRILVTYFGKGTEWLPSNACNYDAYYAGKSNQQILRDNKIIKYLNPWEVAIFKGQKFNIGNKGILHRTPDAALNKKSLLMRLDDSSLFS